MQGKTNLCQQVKSDLMLLVADIPKNIAPGIRTDRVILGLISHGVASHLIAPESEENKQKEKEDAEYQFAFFFFVREIPDMYRRQQHGRNNQQNIRPHTIIPPAYLLITR